MKKILIVQTAFVGDVVLITALIRECKAVFPDSKLDVMVIPGTADVLRNNPHINDLIIYNKHVNKWIGLWKQIVTLSRNDYDLVISPHSSFRTGLILCLAGIPQRVGYNRQISRFFFNIRVPHRNKIHKILKLLDLLKPFSVKDMKMDTELFPSEADRKHVEKLTESLDTQKKTILIAPGSVWPTKCWNKHSFMKLIEMLDDLNLNIILSGNPKEKDLCSEIRSSQSEEYQKRILITAGNTTLLQTVALIEKCNLTICNDSGTLHLSNASNVPVFAFFGPTVQSFGYYPYRENDYVFEADLDCRPCGSHGGKKCPKKHHRCMLDILPETVFLKIRQFIND